MATGTSSPGLGWYLDHIKSTPLLSAKQERQLARLIREHSDPIAREQMIQANLRLVVRIAKDYSTPGMTLGDLVAEGNLGLLRAVEDFDPEAGVRFSTYAAWWVKQAIKKALINAGQPVHIPAYLAKLISRWRRAARELEIQFGRPASTHEIAQELRISQRKANIVQQRLQAASAPSQIGSDETQAAAEMLADVTAQLPEQKMLDASADPTVEKILAKLDDRCREILVLRFGLDEQPGPAWPGENPKLRTYKEIGQIVGLTRERVRQLEKQSLANLKSVIDQYL